MAGTTPILLYHGISTAASRRFRAFVVEPRRFTEQMEHLVASGYDTCTVPDLVARRRAGAPVPERTVAITFDDAFADLTEHVFPVLQRLRLVATVYVPTAYIGRTSGWLAKVGEGARRVLSAEEMRAVPATTIEFGAHSHTHPALDALAPTAARDEVVRSKCTLEDVLGRSITTFAYPFGYERHSTRTLVRQAGFASACRVGYRHSAVEEDVYALSRVPVYHAVDLRSFERLLATDDSLRPRRAIASAWRQLRRGATSVRRLTGG